MVDTGLLYSGGASGVMIGHWSLMVVPVGLWLEIGLLNGGAG